MRLAGLLLALFALKQFPTHCIFCFTPSFWEWAAGVEAKATRPTTTSLQNFIEGQLYKKKGICRCVPDAVQVFL
ncbi:MAG: hypothetical protein J3R72DRAFT_465328 [Linnemannia gamsii]|nr:MAG: hypothetical protein J3R72DRAFT_465328 [Linnemannia gamsii]